MIKVLMPSRARCKFYKILKMVPYYPDPHSATIQRAMATYAFLPAFAMRHVQRHPLRFHKLTQDDLEREVQHWQNSSKSADNDDDDDDDEQITIGDLGAPRGFAATRIVQVMATYRQQFKGSGTGKSDKTIEAYLTGAAWYLYRMHSLGGQGLRKRNMTQSYATQTIGSETSQRKTRTAQKSSLPSTPKKIQPNVEFWGDGSCNRRFQSWIKMFRNVHDFFNHDRGLSLSTAAANARRRTQQADTIAKVNAYLHDYTLPPEGVYADTHLLISRRAHDASNDELAVRRIMDLYWKIRNNVSSSSTTTTTTQHHGRQ